MQVYADHAATTALCPAACEAMLQCMREVYGNPSSLHTPGQQAARELTAARETIAACLGAQAREITFTSGGSEADNQALLSAAALGARAGKRHIVSTRFEHHAVLHMLDKLARQGFSVTLLDVPPSGVIEAEQVRQALRPDSCLVSVMFANNEIGTIEPIAQIGALCREAGVLFHTDAVQAAGQLPIDVEAMHIDLLSLSAHKFYGPKGVGALYARSGVVLSSLIEGGAQERGKRAGTENLPGIVGAAAALREACARMEETAARLVPLRDQLMEDLARIPHSCVNGDRKQRLPGNVNICFEGVDAVSLLMLLDSRGIAASAGSACTAGALEPSHVLASIGVPEEVARGSLRLSLGADNTPEQVDYIRSVLPEVVAYLREHSPAWQAMERGERPHRI